jgi:hypothetical protein
MCLRGRPAGQACSQQGQGRVRAGAHRRSALLWQDARAPGGLRLSACLRRRQRRWPQHPTPPHALR